MKTVKVPPGIEEPFLAAEKLVSNFFHDRHDDPARGTIEIFGERYVLVRAASLSVEFFRLVRELYGPGREREADDFAHNILFDLAHAIGKSDAKNFHSKMGLVDPIAKLSAGPVHFSHTGWAFVDISPESSPTPDENYFLLYDHPYSFEADAWIRAGHRTDFAACVMNSGYSSGWCEESFGIELVATEVTCRARGEPHCRFVMAPPAKIQAYAERIVARRAFRDEEPSSYRVPDFFARKRMEEELRRARDALEQHVAERTRELSKANERLRAEMQERERMEKQLAQAQRLEAIGRLAGGIAHDFNNLMAVILGNAGLALKNLPDEDGSRAFLSEIREAGERAAELTRQLLAFGRAQRHAKEVLDVAEVVRTLGRMLERLIGADVELVFELGREPHAVSADRAQLEQVMVNLVLNARDAMPEGGRISVAVRELDVGEDRAKELGVEAGRFVELSVSDTGIGMTDAVAAQVFDPYFTTKGGKGTGLGLSTVYGIVKQAGGVVTVESELAHGSRFCVLLPHASGPLADRVLGSQQSSAEGGSETVLLVEDQRSLRDVIQKILQDAGYRVIAVGDAEEAALIGERDDEAIDLLLSDVVLPTMTGPQLGLRLLATRPRLRVLYMSGYAGSSDERTEGLDDDLLHKPFAPEELVRRVRRVLDENM